VITVSDVERSNAFYRDVVGVEVVDRSHGSFEYGRSCARELRVRA
jgi:catechol 2,3-dioxygenase-like lactoylglutathione lyase family enzyme